LYLERGLAASFVDDAYAAKERGGRGGENGDWANEDL
jgi:hypothetical protein